jgi:hypothetical protein
MWLCLLYPTLHPAVPYPEPCCLCPPLTCDVHVAVPAVVQCEAALGAAQLSILTHRHTPQQCARTHPAAAGSSSSRGAVSWHVSDHVGLLMCMEDWYSVHAQQHALHLHVHPWCAPLPPPLRPAPSLHVASQPTGPPTRPTSAHWVLAQY